MNEPINDCPAFPTELGTGDLAGGFQSGNERWHAPGMTLRDYFAKGAMEAGFGGHIAHYGHENCWSPADIASHAYEMADAMLRARALPQAGASE